VISKAVEVVTCGMAMVDTVCAGLKREPQPGEVEYVDQPTCDNAAGHPVDVAICLVKLGYPSGYISVVASVGNDKPGDYVIGELYGINTEYINRSNRLPTGRNTITVVNNEDRRFRISPGANMDLNPRFVKNILSHLNPDVLSIRPGYSGIDGDMVSILRNLTDTFVLLDLMKPFGKEWSYILPALPYANAVHCNSNEAMNITNSCSIKDAVDVFLEKGVDIVLITHGGNGADLITPKFHIRQPGFNLPNRAIDPTGCGDAFCAGFIKKIIEFNALKTFHKLSEADLWLILYYAQAVGASCAAAIGATQGVTDENVRELLNANLANIRPS